ncbi:hypothetical protein ENSA5_36530 [Enhygromyxa salina]|uniref:Uncharacterized protein n=1 Tax=Enhygromyxa salina TaxID=215803 RepID=A0A2S9XUM5_9BACT|nr:hypothetical protein [Enhygromyxa salina]PRP96577.1 hypothetical protein ENSA5_36530 [Enhygromyxa salina]
MPMTPRQIETNYHGYREVSIAFRIARAMKLEARGVHLRTGRIRCPMVDASRTELVYGHKALPATDKHALARWAKALGVPPGPLQLIAYASGPLHSALTNLLRGSFDDDAVNSGLIIQLKREVNTGILSDEQFEQHAFNEYVWSIWPSLKGAMINNGFLHSEPAATLYVDRRALRAILAHNADNSPYQWKGVGRVMSRVEMLRLLIGVMGQQVTLDLGRPNKTTRALSIRDLHDFYKYAVFPANVEQRLEAAGLIELQTVIETP